MRIAWVHPSWRDLVIDHLSSEPEARERFLRNCSVHGALLALSLGGGRRGKRELPLLQRDGDWDALTDRLYTLVPELEPAELLGLMDGLELTIHDLSGTPAAHEADALATAVLARLTTAWTTTRAPIAPASPRSVVHAGRRTLGHARASRDFSHMGRTPSDHRAAARPTARAWSGSPTG